MPNWCDNTLSVTHEDPKMINRLVGAFKEGRLCDEFVPVPAELKDTTANGTVREALVEKTGYSDWYDFCVNEWGTKWDVGGEHNYVESDDNSATLSFESAWAPPVGLYTKLEDLGFTVRAMYYEPGMGFAGVYEDGYDETYDMSGSADEVKEQIPEDLDDAFGITEGMREWEEENDDSV